jgi:hypothetical protein
MHNTTASMMAFFRATIIDERQESPYIHHTFATMMLNAHVTDVRGVARKCLREGGGGGVVTQPEI